MDISPAFFWLILAVFLGIIELSTMGLVTIWFAAGALCACILAVIGVPLPAQIAVFLVVSVAVLLAVRPLATKYVNSRAKKTNIDALPGRKLIVKTDIDNIKGTGKVDMDGSTWLALSNDDNIVIKAGETVRVVRVVGAKLVVEREEM